MCSGAAPVMAAARRRLGGGRLDSVDHDGGEAVRVVGGAAVHGEPEPVGAGGAQAGRREEDDARLEHKQWGGTSTWSTHSGRTVRTVQMGRAPQG